MPSSEKRGTDWNKNKKLPAEKGQVRHCPGLCDQQEEKYKDEVKKTVQRDRKTLRHHPPKTSKKPFILRQQLHQYLQVVHPSSPELPLATKGGEEKVYMFGARQVRPPRAPPGDVTLRPAKLTRTERRSAHSLHLANSHKSGRQQKEKGSFPT